MRFSLVASALLALLFSACSSNQYASPRALYARGSTDLGCSIDRLRADSLDGRTRVVRGCDRSATYVEECETCGPRIDRYTCNCTWRLDAVSH